MTTEHPHYTAETALACSATAGGGNHTCQCVYRKTVCDGVNHLCMCGNVWRTVTGAFSRCHCNHERTDMPTPVGISMSATQGGFNATVTISAEASITPSQVLAVQLERAAKALAVLVTQQPKEEDLEDYEGPDF